MNIHADMARSDAIITCPHCGGDHYEDNLLDIGLYREAVREVPRLRFEGRISEAVELLSAYYTIRILNHLRDRWRCECGVTFDA